MKSHTPRKRFGQHFLQDPTIIDQLLRLLQHTECTHLVEIGPGQGVLTQPLLQQGFVLDIVELDRDLVSYLQQKLAAFEQLTIHAADALKFDFEQLVKPAQPLHIVGNLPYNISTPLLFHLLKYAQHIASMTFMLQKEVVDRLSAVPNTSDYGRLSVMMQYHCQVVHQFDVSPQAFNPPPKVESSVVQLFPYAQPPVAVPNIATLQRIVTASFAQRRKTLRNNLKGLLSAEQISACDIDPHARAETLSLAQFAQLTQAAAI